MVYDLPGLSFRDYLEFVSAKTYPYFSLEEVLENHEEIASQISGIENAFVLADNLEIGHGNKIPLWLTGFLH